MYCLVSVLIICSVFAMSKYRIIPKARRWTNSRFYQSKNALQLRNNWEKVWKQSQKAVTLFSWLHLNHTVAWSNSTIIWSSPTDFLCKTFLRQHSLEVCVCCCFYYLILSTSEALTKSACMTHVYGPCRLILSNY